MEPDTSDDEILPEARVFDMRAEKMFEKKFQALEEMWNKPPEEQEDLKIDECEGKKRCRRKPVRKPKANKSVDSEDNRSEDSEGNRSDFEVNSPPKRARRSRRKATFDEKDSIMSEDLIPSIRLPPAAKKRIREQKLNALRQKKRIEMENNRILSACDAVSKEVVLQPVEEIESDHSIMLKIKFLSDISKLTVKWTEKFSSIYEKVADMYNLKASEILLCLEDQTIERSNTVTPLSLNLKYFDILDCFPYKPSDDIFKKSGPRFFLKMQSNDTRKKIDVYGSKFEKLKDFMERYSEMRNIPMGKLSFEFDGEKIEESETPEDLEMESGSCVDVKVLVNSTVVNPDSDIEITAEIISESNRLQICDLD